jgi:large subunit ribosomal protein L4
MDIINLDGKKTGTVDLPSVFTAEVRKDLLHRAVMYQQAKHQQGTHAVKGRGDVAYTRAKMYAQKGTGRARHGAMTVNLFRGGGAAFGPTPRTHNLDMPKKVRRLAISTALSAKTAAKELVVLDEAKTKTHKTKDLVAQLSKLNLKSALFVVDALDQNFDRAVGNIPHMKVVPTAGANVYDILRADNLVVTKEALDLLQARLTGTEEKKAVPAKKTATKKKPAAKKAAPKKTTAKKEAK